MKKNRENSYTVLEAANLKGCTVQALREEIKRGLIAGCSAIKNNNGNFHYLIPKLAFDNHLRGANAVDIERLKVLVKEAVKEAWNELIDSEIKRRVAQNV